MIKLKIPVIVEGKYDKARLSGVIDAKIITTDGFAVFNNNEKKTLLRKACADGAVLLCDSDGGGRLIRSHLKEIVPGKLFDLYTPEIKGKEKRKKNVSKAGILGVEGTDSGVLEELFTKFAASHPEMVCGEHELVSKPEIKKSELYELGLNGTDGAGIRRSAVLKALGLPHEMTVNAFCDAVNMVSDIDSIIAILDEYDAENTGEK